MAVLRENINIFELENIGLHFMFNLLRVKITLVKVGNLPYATSIYVKT